MRDRKRFLTGGVVALTVATSVLAAPVATGAVTASATVGPAGYNTRAIDWKKCPEGDGVAQCATIEVPLDWSSPNSAKTHVGIARRPATDPNKRIGVLVMNPGGPGAAATRYVQHGSMFDEAVHQHFDLVGIDPRGINTSEQVRCDEELVRQAFDARHPANQAGFDRWVSLNRRLVANCREHSGDIVDHVDTMQNVHDMDAVRAALGEEKINFVGFSYGSLLGQQYAEQFPHRVRTMVNDSNMDHSITSTLDFMRGLVAAMEQNFLAFARWCDTTPACALHGQSTAEVYRKLREKVKRGEINYPGSNVPADLDYLTGQLGIYVESPEQWGDAADWLVSLRTQKDDVRTMDELVNDRAPLWCSDWHLPIKDYAEYERLRGKLEKEFPNVGWAAQTDLMVGCVGDPLPTMNPQRSIKIDRSPPLVMIGNRYDMQTPYEWTEAAAEQSGSHLITYEGWGHTVYGRSDSTTKSPCVNEAINAYLIDLRVPEDGLSCSAVERPPA